MVEGEHERRGIEVEALGGLASLTGHGVGAEEAHVVDDVDAAHRLERRVDLAHLERTSPRPTVTLGAASDRVEEPEQGRDTVRLHPGGVEPGAGEELGDARSRLGTSAAR